MNIILYFNKLSILCNKIIKINFQNEIIIKLRNSGDHIVVNGTIKDLNLYTCVYNPAVRSKTVHNILKPCSISVAGSGLGSRQGSRLDLCVTEVILCVSPGKNI